jgi:Protein of unknown function (DUF3179)
LCNSAETYDRRVRGRTLSFGTTGKLRNSDLVMWDRQTQSWWQQYSGRALVGTLAGARLRPLDSQTMSWADFRARYPHGMVLWLRTGFDRPYGTSPYAGYERSHVPPRLTRVRPDNGLAARARVVAVFAPGRPLVIPLATLRWRRVLSATTAGTPVVVLYEPGVASVVDARSIARSRDFGSAAAFDARLRGQTIRLGPAWPGTFVDARTGSRWDITGRARSGPLAGAQLRPLRTDEQLWFAVAAFLPGARLLR